MTPALLLGNIYSLLFISFFLFLSFIYLFAFFEIHKGLKKKDLLPEVQVNNKKILVKKKNIYIYIRLKLVNKIGFKI